ncbi:MAG TPA: asparagine synthase (glutamine-hydrolyzing) [Rhizomicrobium sp.]|jgi:asparagine synthase (glutamine-hydrolysing)|nr:asparagine synthase (glutamine-hydrolyzing) [Rhizomicrobium sp.]
MCGIAGMIMAGGTTPPSAAITTMLDAMAHRGPDGHGRYEAPGIALAQARLAIIDLSTGDQPIFGPGGSVVVANGEIYNYLELKPQFPGAHFVTKGDCELPLFTYARDGARYASDLRGMYGIALHAGVGKSYLTRDPFGIKPLYYAETDAGLIFASEPQAILKTGLVQRRIRASAATELLQLQFTTGRETIFEGIERVMPGETITVTDGNLGARRIEPALPDAPLLDLSEDEALAKLDAALLDSVLVHQRSDVPYGLFFSGGIDSTAILVCMAKLNDRPVRAFTARFPDTSRSEEASFARDMAKAVGAEHLEVMVTAEKFWAQLPAIARAMDDPASDYATVPTYMLAEEAAKEMKVVLCGEGGDELFGGYGRYRSAIRPLWLGGKKLRTRGFLDGFGVLRDNSRSWRDGIAAAEYLPTTHPRTKLQAAQAQDCADWLPHDLLVKLDRCLMAHSLEGRTPMLDPVVADLAFRLPDKLKIRGGLGKYLLRRWLERALPGSRPFAPKRGFTVPVEEWIASRADALAPLVARSAGIAEVCYPGEVESLFRSYAGGGEKRMGIACWQLLFYALWHRIHAEGVSAEGDVFHCLEAA